MRNFSFLICLIGASQLLGADKIDFNRDIRPILTNNCTMCHGPDEKTREGGLRLDVREAAIAKKAIVPGDANASKLSTRIDSQDPARQMPPPASKKSLTAAQKQLLKTWIDQGASDAQHWAFVPPARPKVPPRELPPIDAFVRQRLATTKLLPAKEADRATLLRRVTLDLTGLPPTPTEQEAFLTDSSPNAYEKVVNRLLASTAYAERMAQAWLDLARFADTNGFNNDEDRTQWPWRDWLIEAFRTNLPYDQFVIQQLAGDLLPAATLQQRVATAFLRNQVHNTEGGIIPEEYRVEYVADRVQTTATAFMGLSLQCARCHDHKYDPISTKEYYQFFSFFNNISDKQAGYSNFVAAEPFIRVPSSQQLQLIEQLTQRRQQNDAIVKERQTSASKNARIWEEQLKPTERERIARESARWLYLPLDEKAGTLVHDHKAATRGTVHGKATWVTGKRGQALQLDGKAHVEIKDAPALDGTTPFAFSVWVKPTTKNAGAILSKMDEASAYRGVDTLIDNGQVVVHLVHQWPAQAIKIQNKQALTLNEWHHVAVSYDGSGKAKGFSISVDGVRYPSEVLNDTLKGTTHTPKPLHIGRRTTSLPFQGSVDEVQLFNTTLTEANVKHLFQGESPTLAMSAWAIPPEKRSPQQQQQVEQLYLERFDTEYTTARKAIVEIDGQRQAIDKTTPALMVMEEMPQPRPAFILKRGQYDQRGERVQADVPQVLSALPVKAPRNRLGLAQWLVAPNHPLTARVAVNRFWSHYFGTGFVKTVEDFGVTGELPSHPELLDWLATEFIASGWDVKALQKMIVMSATYRQSSALTPTHLELDPENRLLARGPRQRLAAETIRDQALAASGLLVTKVGGPSVKPYQPAGLWEDVTVERRGRYVQDAGDGLYRRSMYTFWKRTCPPPTMAAFDAPNREVCVARRATTNTPLQALVLLNDPTYMEAARKLAERMLASSAKPSDRVAFGFRCVLARVPTEAETTLVLALLDDAQKRFTQSPDAAKQLLKHGMATSDKRWSEVELAAWTTVANVLLNLDETVTKR